MQSYEWLIPRPGLSLLMLAVLIPGVVGRYVHKKVYHSPEEFPQLGDESLLKGFAIGCGALFIVVVSALTLFGFALWPHWFKWGQVAPVRWQTALAGAAIMIGGVLLASQARIVLAGNWMGAAELRMQHQLVTEGPYRWIRHPMYVGFVLTAVGVSVATMNVVPLLVEGGARLPLLYRSIAEERNLEARFGDAFHAYRARTGRFFPRLKRRA